MKLPDYYSYTATFAHDDDGWLVEFPDLERCSTNADSLDEAILQANNILEDYMAIIEHRSEPVPSPTPYEQVETPDNGEKQRIVVPMKEARMRWQNKIVKRTVALPAWIVQVAAEKGLNLSTVLHDSLIRRLREATHAGV